MFRNNCLHWSQIRDLIFLENIKLHCQLPNPSGFQEQDPKEHYKVKQTEVLEICITSLSNMRLVESCFWQFTETQLNEPPRNSRTIVWLLLPVCGFHSPTELQYRMKNWGRKEVNRLLSVCLSVYCENFCHVGSLTNTLHCYSDLWII